MTDSRFSSTLEAAFLFIVGLLAGCSTHAIRSDANSVKKGIAAAIERSDLGAYTKNGCLSSLTLWGPTVETPRNSPPGLAGGMFFLGDSWLSYNFVILSSEEGQPSLTEQSLDSDTTKPITASEFGELTNLIAAGRYDKPPAKPASGLHSTCVVFLDRTGAYFVAHLDKDEQTVRSTDKALELVNQLAKVAP